MTRAISIAVLAIVFASVVAPLALANPASVQACCRVGGKHHCMGTGMAGLDGFHAQPGKCPYRVSTAATSRIAAAVSNGSEASLHTVEPAVAILPTTRAIGVALGDVPKRGPPSA